MVIGFKKGTVPMASVPGIARTPRKQRRLSGMSNCRLNLAGYLTNRKEKIGIIAKGCDARNIVTHIIENKISREQLYIIGVPCTGMVDKGRSRHCLRTRSPLFPKKGSFFRSTPPPVNSTSIRLII